MQLVFIYTLSVWFLDLKTDLRGDWHFEGELTGGREWLKDVLALHLLSWPHEPCLLLFFKPQIVRNHGVGVVCWKRDLGMSFLFFTHFTDNQNNTVFSQGAASLGDSIAADICFYGSFESEGRKLHLWWVTMKTAGLQEYHKDCDFFLLVQQLHVNLLIFQLSSVAPHSYSQS